MLFVVWVFADFNLRLYSKTILQIVDKFIKFTTSYKLHWRNNMSLLATLRPQVGSTRKTKRLGRGRGSGQGGRAGKGNKGQKARKSGNIRRGFEGGQTPLHRRFPKIGFKNTMFTTRYEVVNLSALNELSGEVNPVTLASAGLVKSGPVKILARGDLKKALTVKAHKFSETAKAAIEKAGGKVEVISL
jgi:large subunit ribosomal protein L15